MALNTYTSEAALLPHTISRFWLCSTCQEMRSQAVSPQKRKANCQDGPPSLIPTHSVGSQGRGPAASWHHIRATLLLAWTRPIGHTAATTTSIMSPATIQKPLPHFKCRKWTLRMRRIPSAKLLEYEESGVWGGNLYVMQIFSQI